MFGSLLCGIAFCLVVRLVLRFLGVGWCFSGGLWLI